MNIRLMSLSDYEEVYLLWTSIGSLGMRSLDDSKEGIAKFIMRNPATNFVAVIDDKVIGVILCGHDGRRGYIYHMAVGLDHRNKGIGRTLVNHALEALKKEGINKAALVAFESNQSGNAFWERLGFGWRKDLIYRDKSLNQQI